MAFVTTELVISRSRILPTEKYGNLTPVIPVGRVNGRFSWLFSCDCGATKVIPSVNVLNNHVKTCGHFRRKAGLIPRRKKFREELLKSQGNFCAICKQEFTTTPEIDHDHTCCPQKEMCRKCVRGLLCDVCNRGLGCFRDRVDLLESALAYLKGGFIGLH